MFDTGLLLVTFFLFLIVLHRFVLGSVQVLYKHVRGGVGGKSHLLILLMWLGGGSGGKMLM